MIVYVCARIDAPEFMFLAQIYLSRLVAIPPRQDIAKSTSWRFLKKIRNSGKKLGECADHKARRLKLSHHIF